MCNSCAQAPEQKILRTQFNRLHGRPNEQKINKDTLDKSALVSILAYKQLMQAEHQPNLDSFQSVVRFLLYLAITIIFDDQQDSHYVPLT